MRNGQIKRMVITSLFSALICAATAVIHIPIPGANGYIHPGDALVIVSGAVLGPAYGAVAAGIGSALADLLSGYAIYIPATVIIKCCAAFAVGIICKATKKRASKNFICVLTGGMANTILIVGGYLLFECVIYSPAAALSAIPANIIQGVFGTVAALIIHPLLMSVQDIKSFSEEIYKKKK